MAKKRKSVRRLSRQLAKKVFDLMWRGGRILAKIIEHGLTQVTDRSEVQLRSDVICFAKPGQGRAGKLPTLGWFGGPGDEAYGR